MNKVKSVEVQCGKCGRWFESPIMFGNMESFDLSIMYGNKVQCQYCGMMTGCNKENMRVRAENTGFKGNETK